MNIVDGPMVKTEVDSSPELTDKKKRREGVWDWKGGFGDNRGDRGKKIGVREDGKSQYHLRAGVPRKKTPFKGGLNGKFRKNRHCVRFGGKEKRNRKLGKKGLFPYGRKE